MIIDEHLSKAEVATDPGERVRETEEVITPTRKRPASVADVPKVRPSVSASRDRVRLVCLDCCLPQRPRKAETVRLSYDSIPGMDTNSPSYLKARRTLEKANGRDKDHDESPSKKQRTNAPAVPPKVERIYDSGAPVFPDSEYIITGTLPTILYQSFDANSLL